MIYGLNFNRTTIPDKLRLYFAAELPIYECRTCGMMVVDRNYHAKHMHDLNATFQRWRPKGETGRARLQGVATSWEESRAMCIQADNGNRRVWRVRRYSRHGNDGEIFGIYCY